MNVTTKVKFWGKNDRSEVCEFLDEIKESLLSSNLSWPEFSHLYFSVIHGPSVFENTAWQTVSAEGLIVNISGLAGYMVSVAATHYSMKDTLDYT